MCRVATTIRRIYGQYRRDPAAMIDCIGPWREATRRALIERHPDLQRDTIFHLAWIATEPETRSGWTVWWEGETLREANVPFAVGELDEQTVERNELLRDLVNRAPL